MKNSKLTIDPKTKEMNITMKSGIFKVLIPIKLNSTKPKLKNARIAKKPNKAKNKILPKILRKKFI